MYAGTDQVTFQILTSQPMPPPPSVGEGIIWVKMAIVPTRNRDMRGPQSGNFYRFSPWAWVDSRDQEELMAVRSRKGCACNGNQREMPMFATEEQILSGQVKPEWNQ